MLTPEQLARTGDEHGHQAALIHWIATVGARAWPELRRTFAVPNGANYGGDRKTGARMRAEGLRSGVPDLFLPWTPRPMLWPGLWIELKRPGREREKNWGRSDAQVDWSEWLSEQGWCVVVACGWRPAAAALVRYASCAPMGEGAAHWEKSGLYLYAGEPCLTGCLGTPNI